MADTEGRKNPQPVRRIALVVAILTIAVVVVSVSYVVLSYGSSDCSNNGLTSRSVLVTEVQYDKAFSMVQPQYSLDIQTGYYGGNTWLVNYSDFRIVTANSSYSPQIYGMPDKNVILSQCQSRLIHLNFAVPGVALPVGLIYTDEPAGINIRAPLPSQSNWLYLVRTAWVTVQGTNAADISWHASINNYRGFYHAGETMIVDLLLQHDMSNSTGSVPNIFVTSVTNDQGLSVAGVNPSYPVNFQADGTLHMAVRLAIPTQGFSDDIHLIVTLSN